MKQVKSVAINGEIVGVRNLKTTHNWRLEIDIYEMDTEKVKELIDILNKPLSIGIVEHEQ